MTKILIAEDETDIRELIRLTLTFSGFNVTLARDGQEAVELAPSDDFDLIMMDVRMPRKTGYEACREIKQNDRFQHTPVIFLTARGQETEMQEGLDAGATAYILKPFAPDELIRKINQVLAQTA
jgi:DNA-binding response OmpR family regulator